MLQNSVILILREVLEAAVLIALLMAISSRMRMKNHWLAVGVTIGLLGAFAYGARLGVVSDWFEGRGQEAVNAALQFSVYLCLLIIVHVQARKRFDLRMRALLHYAMTLTTSMAIMREGSEIYLFLSGYVTAPDIAVPVLSGAFIGAGIGCSVGGLLYVFLISIPVVSATRLTFLLMVLVGAGMCAQAAQLLIQADWLPSTPPLWDTSKWIAEDSVVGELLYAVFGYEATPTSTESVIYTCSLLMVLCTGYLCRSNSCRSAGSQNEYS